MSSRSGFTHHSLRRRILLLTVAASVLSALAVACAVVLYEARTFRPRTLDSLLKSSRMLQEVLPAALDFGGVENAESYLKTYAEETNQRLCSAAVYDGQGVLFAAWPNTNASPIPKSAQPNEPVFSRGSLVVWLPIERNGLLLGHLYLEEALPPLYARLPQYGIMVTVVALTVGAVALALLIGTRYYVIRPLSALLRTTTEVILNDDYRVRAKVERDDEIGEIAKAFNRMLEAVGARDAALRDERAKLEQVFRATTEVAIVATDTSGTITMFNVGAERMLGYAASELVGHETPIRWHVLDEIRQMVPEAFANATNDRELFRALIASITPSQSFAGETTFVAKDGRKFPVQLAITAVSDPTGHISGYLGIGADLSQRKQAERDRERLQVQLIQSQKIEAIGQLAGGVAHDFNNILGAMMMQTDLMRLDYGAQAKLTNEIAELQTYINRAANLTRQLLLFSRRQVTQVQRIDLNSLLGNLLKMLRRIIGEDIRLEFTPAPGSAWIEADANMIEQVVINLAVNSRDAMPTGGRLLIGTNRETFDEARARAHPNARPGAFISLTVEDTGCGMDEATLHRIFEPFFTTKEPGKGTGLGLATAYGIVAKHEGWMDVKSVVGVGTAFTLYLPQKEVGATEAAAEIEAEDNPRGDETVLYVEDDPDVRALGVTALQRWGYQVLVAQSGPEALHVWETHGQQTQLLLTDMIMPGGMTGLELANTVRRWRPQLPVIITSGYSLELSQGGWNPSSDIDYLAKPFQPKALAKAIRRKLDSSRAGS
ncbi:ATP-binding protein [Nibricoccus sp. IMCC34717]|uniref:ATP-binding protein n=1 Tax=Nibricoccus sp. IMCC34717 TaxID=3034021 RepID=UPI00384E84B3